MNNSEAQYDERMHALGGVALEALLRVTVTILRRNSGKGSPSDDATAGQLIGLAEKALMARTDLPSETVDRLVTVLAQCRKAHKQRNRAIHDAWAFDTSGEVIQIRANGEPRKVDVSDLIKVNHDIQDCIIDLFNATLGIHELTVQAFAKKIRELGGEDLKV